jgi:hypothetical protein
MSKYIASLSLDKFSALTASAPIDILGNNYGYTYQWYKDGLLFRVLRLQL